MTNNPRKEIERMIATIEKRLERGDGYWRITTAGRAALQKEQDNG